MANLSLAEIVKTVRELKGSDEKVAFLKQNDSMPLRNILKLMYDKNMNILLPSTAPPYTPSEFPDTHGLLYREARKLKYFVEGFGGEKVDKLRRESLFIQMLEMVHKEDAELLCFMIAQKPLKGLTAAVINEAFPELQVPVKGKKKEAAESNG